MTLTLRFHERNSCLSTEVANEITCLSSWGAHNRKLRGLVKPNIEHLNNMYFYEKELPKQRKRVKAIIDKYKKFLDESVSKL